MVLEAVSLIAGFKLTLAEIRKPIIPPSAYARVPKRPIPTRRCLNTSGKLNNPGTYIHPSCLKPVHRLPNELLCAIFDIYCAESALPKDASAIVLSHVCRRWREIILQTSEFWTNIVVRRVTEHTSDRLQAYLSRSRTRGDPHMQPLTLDIDPNQETTLLDAILKSVLRDIGRCKHLKISTDLPRIDAFLDRLPASGGMPLLTSLDFKAYMWRFPEGIPWARLTSLSLDCPLTGDCILELLPRCPGLVSLNLKKVVDTPITPPPYEEEGVSWVVVLADLKTLSITSDDAPNALYERLCCPILQNIALTNISFSMAPIEPTVIDAFLRRSECNLLSFTLSDPEAVDDHIVQWLRLPSLQSITHLTLQSPSISAPILDTLAATPTPHQPVPLPSLTDLEVAKCVAGDSHLLDMVASRLGSADRTVSNLRNLKATMDRGVDRQPADFTTLREAGVNVDVSYADLAGQIDFLGFNALSFD
ncbi:hypothetical protein PLEOSDRAFT_1097873 [Pleurotus ostreatus PC15]|uniref:F-box domain-containing protein n=1 Tax=Pleurotus ostreatus (strain PC15) TaxID=1137138 RepID=A0A067NLF1_PLEO1|nr:hypothetical protein PLEOSDRAFT_1097873 [Pleurotus ostreatus PC15]